MQISIKPIRRRTIIYVLGARQKLFRSLKTIIKEDRVKGQLNKEDQTCAINKLCGRSKELWFVAEEAAKKSPRVMGRNLPTNIVECED